MRTSPLHPPDRRRPPRFRRWPALVLLAAFALPSGGPVRGFDTPELTPGEEQTREMGAGEVHRYPFSLAAGEFLRAVVAEDGIDVEVVLLDPQGLKVLAVDGPFTPHDDEELAAIAESAGLYQLEVRAGSHGQPGRYRIRTEQRPAGDDDRARVEAVRLSQAATDLIGKPGTLRDQVKKRERASALWHQLGERGHEAAALYQLGTARFDLGRYGEAAEDLHRAAALWRELGADVNQADALNECGRTDVEENRREEAEEHYERALALLQAPAADPLLKARVLNNLGYVLSDLDQPRAALERLEEALPLARQSRQRSAVETQVSILNNLGSAYADLSESREALTSYQKGLDLARSPQKRAAVLNNIGDLYDSLGDWEKAIRYYQDALAIDRAQNDGPNLARTFNNLGLAQQRAGQREQARQAYDQALVFARKSKDRQTEAKALYNLGYLELSLGHPSAALEPCRQALAMATGDRGIEAAARDALGSAYREMGQLNAASTELEKALEISQERGDGIREANVRLNLARVARARGDLDGAITLTGEAIDLVESIRTRVASPDLRAAFLASVQSYYELDIDSLMAKGGHEAEALKMSERARARSFLELLNSSGASLRQEIPAELILRERKASDGVSLAERRRARLLADPRSDPASVTAAVRDREAALDVYQQVEGDVRAASPRYASLTQPIGLPEIQKLLDGGTLLLEYALGEKRSYLWVVTPTGIRSFRLPPRAQIEKVARRYYVQVTLRSRGEVGADRRAQADAAAAAAARELSRLVLAPAAGLLAERRLVVVSDGALQYIPFAALPDPTVTASNTPRNATATAVPYLVERHEILSLPSASVLSVLRHQLALRPRPQKTLAVIADPVFQPGDPRVRRRPVSSMDVQARQPRGAGTDRECGSQSFPRLPFSGEEEKAIASLVPKEKRLEAFGFDASLPMVLSGALASYGLVHFATHGCIDNRHPELSGLVLSQVDAQGRPQDGLLWLKDIYDLHLNADLVVLSACQTALGKEIQGEGLIGLTRGFLYAGSARVVASLWKVQDRPTYQLMKGFYGAMLGKPPQRPAAALRQAQLDLAKNALFASPYFWAGFSLQGEWR